MSKFVARFACYFAFILMLLSGNVASRHLHYDDAKLVSDGVTDGGTPTRVEEPFLRLKGMDSHEEQCNHMYGILPCLGNLSRQICLLMMYEILLVRAESWAGGDGRLFRVFGKNYWSLLFFQLLDALPDSLILLAMGLSTSEEKAQEYVITGVGMLAGSSILLPTLLWGLCFRNSLKESHAEPEDYYVTWRQLLTGYGVLTDLETKYHAKVMFYSLIPFVVILLPSVFGLSYSSQEYEIVLLVSLLVSVLCVISYFIYQYRDPRIQIRRLEYAEAEHIADMHIPFYEVQELMLDRERRFMIMEREMEIYLIGNLEIADEKFTKKKFHDDIFKSWIKTTRKVMDDPRVLEYNKVLELLHENKKYLIDIISSELEVEVQAQDKSVIYRSLSFLVPPLDKDGYITQDELKTFIKRLNDKEFLTDDGIAEIMQLYFLDSDSNGKIDVLEFKTGVSKWLESRKLTNQAQGSNQETQNRHSVVAVTPAIICLLVGTGMIFGLAEPLVESVREFSESLGMGPFILNFILVPLTTNIRAILAAIKVTARDKTYHTTSVTFSEIYHKVFLNNIVGFSVIVAVIYFRGLTWHFSAEILVVISVCIIMGFLGSLKTKLPYWTLLIVILLYPLSLWVMYHVNDAFQFT